MVDKLQDHIDLYHRQQHLCEHRINQINHQKQKLVIRTRTNTPAGKHHAHAKCRLQNGHKLHKLCKEILHNRCQQQKQPQKQQHYN